jgi:predicted ATPase
MIRKTKSLRFTRVKLTNWRNFRQAEVRLQDRAFFIGPNASGKSNFLDALRFLRDLAKPVGGGLATAVAERGGLSAIRCVHARRPSWVEIDVDIGNDEDQKQWGYRVRFNNKPRKSDCYVLEEFVKFPNGEIQNFVEGDSAEEIDIYRQTGLEQSRYGKDLRELSEFLVSSRYLHVVPQIIRDNRRTVTDAEDPFGGDLLQRMKALNKRSRGARLNLVSDALRIAVPQFETLDLKDDDSGRPHLHASYKHWRQNPTTQSEVYFSDGTLRLIGFLWSISEKGGPLLLEEPELSLHESVVEKIAAMIARSQRFSGRQVIATTHSPVMLYDRGIGIDEVHILRSTDDGTVIVTAGDDDRIRGLVEDGGWSVGEASYPATKPEGVERLEQLKFAF